jgi:hypothetical protein
MLKEIQNSLQHSAFSTQHCAWQSGRRLGYTPVQICSTAMVGFGLKAEATDNQPKSRDNQAETT